MPQAPALETVQLTRTIDRRKRPRSFFKNIAFTAPRLLDAETVRVGRIEGDRDTAPFSLPGTTALLVGGRRAGESQFTVPNIRIKTPVNPGDLGWHRQMMEDPFESSSRDFNRKLAARVAYVQGDLDNRISNTEEFMAAQMLFKGQMTYSVVGHASWTIDFEKPAANTVVLGAAAMWDTPTAFPEMQFRQAKQVVQDGAGIALTDVMLGSEAAAAFIQNEGIRQRLDGERYETGFLNLEQDFLDGGSVNFLGRFMGVRVWEYIAKLTVNGVVTDLVEPKMAEFFSRSAGTNQELVYGAITDDFDAIRRSPASSVLHLSGVGTMTTRFSKAWQDKDPSSLYILMQSRPLPVTHTPDATYSVQVVS